MNKVLHALILLLVVSSCASPRHNAPRDLDNACTIVNDNPAFLRAFKAAEREWGTSIPGMMAMIHQESKFIADNRPPHRYAMGIIPTGRQSSAYGYSQALDGTWREYQDQENRPRARRDNIHDAADFMGWYMAKSQNQLGLQMTDVYNQYLAYHEGRGGYRSGSYNAKPWLIRVARKVADRAVMYDLQLQDCGKI